MKLFYLVFYNLKKLFKDQFLLFILVIISSMFSAFGILFFAGYLAGDFDAYIRIRGDELWIEDLSGDEMGEKIWNAITELDMQEITDIVCSQGEIDGGQQEIMGEYHTGRESRVLCGEFFAADEEAPVVILDEDRAAALSGGELPLGMAYSFEGLELEVAGVVFMTDFEEIMVPVAFFLKNFPVHSVRISLQHTLTEQQREEMEAVFEKYSVKGLAWKSPGSPWSDAGFWIDFVQVLLIFGIICINILVLIYYLFIRMKRNFCIYAVCGGSSRQIFSVIFLQAFLHIMVGVFLGIIASIFFFYIMHDATWLLHDNPIYYTWVAVFIIFLFFLFSLLVERLISSELEIYQVTE